VDISGPVSLSPAVAPTNTVGLYNCLFTPLKSGERSRRVHQYQFPTLILGDDFLNTNRKVTLC
jgi:hypothetical protein